MEIKDILLFLEAGRPCDAPLALGVALARTHGAVLTALCACPEPAMDPADGYAIGPEAVGDALARRAAAIARALAPSETAFWAAARTADIEAHWTRAVPNETPLQLATRARFYDVAIAPRPTGHDHAGHRLAELAALTSGTPCLIVPARPSHALAFDRVLVAWNGSREAKRALADALVFLKRAQYVGLVTVDGEDAEEGEAASGEAMLAHLARHGVSADLKRTRGPRVGDGSALLAECASFGADLLVMGAYGHSRAEELILGGATRTILAEAPLPVLMSH